MSSDPAKTAAFVLRRVAQRMKLELAADDGEIAYRSGLTVDEREGFRFRVHNGVFGAGMRMAAGFVSLEDIRRGGEALVGAIERELALAAAELGIRPMPMMCKGTFRVHFNRHGAAPLVWSVATDSWELAIAELVIDGAEVRTVYRPKPTPDDEDGKPSAWLEVTGVLAVAGGEARITRSAA